MAPRRMIVPSLLVASLFFAGAVAVMVLVVDFLTGPKKDDTDAEIRAEQHHTVLWKACARYAADHSGEYPSSLGVLVSQGYIDDAMIRYVGREGALMEILYQPPTDDATEDAVMLCDSHPTFVGLWTHGYVAGKSDADSCFVYATTVGGYQDHVPYDQVRSLMKNP